MLAGRLVEPCRNVLDGITVITFVLLPGYVAEVRRCQNIIECSEWVILWKRFDIKDVESRACQPLLFERLDKSNFVDDWPARGVDQPGCRLHLRQLLGANQASGGIDKNEMNGENIRLGEELFLGDKRGSDLGGLLLGCAITPRNYLHLEGLSNSRDFTANPSKT